MSIRFTAVSMAVVALVLASSGFSAGGDFFVGCRTRPACGKICKLVCEKKTLSVTCYGCECAEICIPGPSRPGCKYSCAWGGEAAGCGHCGTAACVCGGQGRVGASFEDQPPKCEFCWRDWFARGWAKPRTVKTLTKYEAEREICWYHWEVVDAASCDDAASTAQASGNQAMTAAGNPAIYKPAPQDAQIGDVFPLSDEEQAQLASFTADNDANQPIHFATQAARDPFVPPPIQFKPQPIIDAPPDDTTSAALQERLRRFFDR